MEKRCPWDGNELTQILISDFNKRPQSAYICKECGRVFDYHIERLLGVVPEAWAMQKILETGLAKLVLESGRHLVRPIERKKADTLADFLAECILAWIKPKIEKGEKGEVIIMTVNPKKEEN